MVTKLQDTWAVSPDNSSNTLDVTFGSAPTDGSTLFMAVGAEGAEVTSINQSGATWVKANGISIFGNSFDLWIAQNIISAGVIASIIMNGNAHIAGILVEYSDLVQTGAIIDQVGSPTTGISSVTMDSGGTTTQSDELLIAIVGSTGGSLQQNPSDGFTEVNQILQGGLRRLGFYNRIVSSMDWFYTTVQINPPNVSLGFMTTFFAEATTPPSFKAFLAASLPKRMG